MTDTGSAATFADVKVWGDYVGDVCAQCQRCWATYYDGETLADLVKWAGEHDCQR